MWIAFMAMAFGGVALITIGWLGWQGRLKRQGFAGIRTPYTMASDERWIAVHKHGAPYMIFGGVGAVAMCLSLLPFAIAGQLPDTFALTMVLIIGGMVLLSALASWWYGVRGAKAELGAN